jgi:amino acid transporter
MEAGPVSAKKPRLTLLDCLALGINGIVGSGIFLLPGQLAEAAGPSSVIAFVVCGAICVLIALCFAEASGQTERTGGAYAYARLAFGETTSFAVGWMSLIAGVEGFAAVARGLATQLARLWTPLASSERQALFAAGLILLLGLINALGLKAGARTSDLFSVVKIGPLLAFVVLGLWHLEPSRLTPFWPSSSQGFARAVFIAVFACSGFEYVAVPAGDAEQARRDIPRALIGSLLGATVIYALVQLAAVGSGPIAGSQQPLADSAERLWGPSAATAVGLAAVVSMAGFCASSAFIGPRLFVAFAEEGVLPASFAEHHPKLDTPVRAIVLSSGLAAVAAWGLDLDKLVNLSIGALFAQYLPTCLAVMVLRRTQPNAPRTFKLPFGDLIPVLAVLVSLAMLIVAQPSRDELIGNLIVLGVGFVLYGLRRWTSSRSPSSSAKSGPD